MTPVGHDEVSSLRDDWVEPDLVEDVDDVVPLALEVNGDGLEVALGRVEAGKLKFEAPERMESDSVNDVFLCLFYVYLATASWIRVGHV